MTNSHRDIHDDLIESAKKGDKNAQYALYSSYSRSMLNTSFRILNDREEARDVLQESFIKVFKNLHGFRKEASFGAWVKRIVINDSLAVLRKRKNHSEEPLAEHDYYQEEELESEMSVEQIRNAVARLPDGFRTVFSLYAFEGYDHKEIAGILSIAESTSKTQYNRSKVKIRQLIKEMYGYER